MKTTGLDAMYITCQLDALITPHMIGTHNIYILNFLPLLHWVREAAATRLHVPALAAPPETGVHIWIPTDGDAPEVDRPDVRVKGEVLILPVPAVAVALVM